MSSNIQCRPTPIVWEPVAVTVVTEPATLTDENGNPLTDENSNPLLTDLPAAPGFSAPAGGDTLTDENQNTLVDENGNPLVTD